MLDKQINRVYFAGQMQPGYPVNLSWRLQRLAASILVAQTSWSVWADVFEALSIPPLDLRPVFRSVDGAQQPFNPNL